MRGGMPIEPIPSLRAPTGRLLVGQTVVSQDRGAPSRWWISTKWGEVGYVDAVDGRWLGVSRKNVKLGPYTARMEAVAALVLEHERQQRESETEPIPAGAGLR